MSQEIFEKIKNKYNESQINDVQDIVLDTFPIKEFTQEIKDYMEKFINVTKLSLNMCLLKNLSFLPQFKNLIEIELSDNHLHGKDIEILSQFQLLNQIKIANNKIENFNDLEPLKKLRDLSFLDLSENPVIKTKDYRKKLYDMIPNLVYLDLIDKNGKSYEDFEEEEDEKEELEEEEKEKDENSFIVENAGNEEEEESEDENEEEVEEIESENANNNNNNNNNEEGEFKPGKKRKLE